MSFSLAPAPLTPRQRTVVAGVALFCAAGRFLAMARSWWDWDEALFMLAMRDYDVSLHHPHPPGFPVYIAMARLLRLVIGDDFRALQAVNLIAGALVFPAVFLLARELRLRFSTCAIAGALFAFFPNVWFFGGGAFSDIPSIVLVVFAVGLFFRSIREPSTSPVAGRNAYWIGTLLLALAIGIRPQNLLLGVFPGFLATRGRRPFEIAVALLIGLVVTGVAFGGAIAASESVGEYVRVVREHGDYISRVDSWRSPARPPMWRLFDRFFIKQYQSPVLSVLTSLFVVVSISGSIRERSRPMLYNALTFTPFAIVAWMMLDRFSISRFSIGYQPMFALFLADGIRRAAWWGAAVRAARARGSLSGWLTADRRPPAADDHETASRASLLEIGVAGSLAVAFIAYTFPALASVRNELAPSLLATRAVSEHVDPVRDQLFVGHTMSKFVDLVLPGFPYTRVMDDRAMPLAARKRAWLLAEITDTAERGFVFRRDRGSLWNIARRHYFEIKLEPLRARPRFISGWYGPESMDIHEWRWMNGHSVTLLPPARGKTMLRLHLGVPRELMPRSPLITIKLNGRVLDAFRTSDGYLERDYRVMPAPRGLPNVLELFIDRTVLPADDGRELGLRLRYLGWGKA